MTRILCVANQKGGVGKTTTAINLSAGLARAGCRTMLIDLDPQGNATTGLGQRLVEPHPLLRPAPLLDASVVLGDDPWYLVPGSRSFRDADSLVQADDIQALRLIDRIERDTSSLEYVLFDCPPSLGPLTQAALCASTEVLMPIQCEYFAMEGLTQMIDMIRAVIRRPETRLEFGGILLTMYDHTLELTLEVDREVREYFGQIVFDAVIPRDVAVSEAPSYGQSVLDYAPRSRGSRAYTELCMEVLERV
ncbi:MAG: ParA family protein [Pirellulales bacterium]